MPCNCNIEDKEITEIKKDLEKLINKAEKLKVKIRVYYRGGYGGYLTLNDSDTNCTRGYSGYNTVTKETSYEKFKYDEHNEENNGYSGANS